MQVPGIARRPFFWLAAFLLWFAILWNLSSGPVMIKTGIEIPHFDKVQHFGYFFGGSGLLTAFFFRRKPDKPDWTMILTSVTIALTAVGCLDEWHQSCVSERSGNDAQDLSADVLGSIAGVHVFRRLQHLLR